MSKRRASVCVLFFALVAAVPSHNVSTRRGAADASSSKRVIRFAAREGGWDVSELFDHIHRTTGIAILYDGCTGTFKQSKVRLKGDEVVEEERLFDWLQPLMNKRKQVLVPIGPQAPGFKRQWFVMDAGDPNIRARTVYVAEEDIERYADRSDLYVVSTLTMPFTRDTTRMRNALIPLVTQEMGIGRLQDIPGSQRLIVGDYGPVVAKMHRQIVSLDVEFAMSDLIAQLTAALPLTTTPSGSSNVTPQTAPAIR